MRYRETMPLPDTVVVDIEVSRFSFVKHRPDGVVDFVSPLPSLFSYGSVLGVLAADGDPQDALVVGAAPRRGSRCELAVHGQVLFVDAGVDDNKWVVGPRPPHKWEWAVIEAFFRVYAVAKRRLAWMRGNRGTISFNGVEQTSGVAG